MPFARCLNIIQIQSVSNKIYIPIYRCKKPEPLKYIEGRQLYQRDFHGILEDNPLDNEALGIQGVSKKQPLVPLIVVLKLVFFRCPLAKIAVCVDYQVVFT